MTYPGAGIEIRSFEPYYQQLKRILIKEIENNHKEGDLLPSESELCRRYSVSRTVVRQALGELEGEGLVLKVKGKGTYVTGRPLNTSFVQHSLGFYESMQRAGHMVGTRVIVLQTEPCGASLAKVLEIGMEDVIHFDRVRSVDGIPVQVVRTALPARLFPGLVERDMTDCSLYQVLADVYGVRPATGHRAIDATALSGEDAHYLQATEGLPALRIESVTRTSEGVVFEYYVAIYRGHSFKFELDVTSP